MISDELKQEKNSLASMELLSHIIELRKYLVRIFGIILILLLCIIPFSNNLYEILSEPLRLQLPTNTTMIATDITTTFMAPLKLSLFIAMIVAMPFILYQIWLFVTPALYKREKKIAIPLLFSSITLFYIGISFAYFITLPAILSFFIHATPDAVVPMTDISSYLNFCLKLFLIFGLTFEIPVAIILLILINVISVKSLENNRRYIIVGCFFVSMFITPPDALSMLMLAIPMWVLFEIGLAFGKFIEKSIIVSNNKQ